MNTNSISNSDRSRLGLAYRIAEANIEYPNHRFGAVLYRSGSTLAVGWNKYRNDPYQVDSPREQASVHAEADVLSRVADASGSVLYVARLTPGGRSGLAMPCRFCTMAIIDAGVKRVVYSLSVKDGLEACSISPSVLAEVHCLESIWA